MFASRRRRRGSWLVLTVALLVTLAPAASQAQDYPSRPIRLVVPFAAGGLNDVVARLVGPYLERALGQPVIVDNRPAASGIVGTDAVAKAPPEGITLLMVASSHTVVPATKAKLPYDAERDLAPITMVAKNSLMFLVNPKVEAQSLAEFIALRQSQSRQVQLRLARRGLANPSGGRTAEPESRHQAAAHPLSRRRAGDAGDGGRRYPFHSDLDPAVAAAYAPGALRAIATGGLTREPSSPICRRWPSRAFPASRQSNGSGCSPPRERPSRSSSASMRRPTARCATRT